MKVRLKFGVQSKDGEHVNIFASRVESLACIPRKGEHVVLREGEVERRFIVDRVDHLVGAPTGIVAALICREVEQ